MANIPPEKKKTSLKLILLREVLAQTQTSQLNLNWILAEHSAGESVSLPRWGGLIHPVEGAGVGKAMSAWEMSNT